MSICSRIKSLSVFGFYCGLVTSGTDRISDPTGDWMEVVRMRDLESRLKPRWSTAGRRDLAKGDGGGATVPTLQCRGTVHGREKAARVSPGSLRKPETIICFCLPK